MSSSELEQVLGGFGIVAAIIGILWFLLPIVLFFKVWNMTNDVAEIVSILKEQMDLEHPYVESADKDGANKPK